MLAVVDPTTAIGWPTLGVAGGAIVSLLLLLGWLVRRQASGAWMTKEEHDAQVVRIEGEKARAIAASEAERDRAVAASNADRDSWRAAHDALARVHGETVTAFRQATDANRAFDILLRQARFAPQQGDTSSEGVPA
jgi:hypothetical protein